MPKKPIKKKKQLKKIYTEDDHIYVRYLHEIRGFSLFRCSQVSEIPYRTVQSWKQKENWASKGSESNKIELFTRESFIRLAAESGMPQRKAVELLVAGMTDPKVYQDVSELNEKKELVTVAKEAPDYGMQHKYQRDFWRLSGMMDKGAPININDNEGTVNIQVNIPDKAPLP